jgi:glutamine amidotransferase
VLGICLGMQLLFEHSAEGNTAGLGILPGRIGPFVAAPGLPVPHMGWNTLRPLCDDPLLRGIGTADWFYFVHGYRAPAGVAGAVANDRLRRRVCIRGPAKKFPRRAVPP